MGATSWFIFVLLTVTSAVGQEQLNTVYDYYTEGGIESGLETTADNFLLNGKNITLITGTIHYFRVHPDYWRDRLRKLRASGFIGVETYIPWNWHEPEIGVFDFGDGDSEFSPFLDVVGFLKMAQEEDLLVILRPGPFINAEWENGGLPSWLYRDSTLKTRSSNSAYISYMTEYFNALFPLLRDLQFTAGGPIVALQIENEYGTVARGQHPPDTAYLEEIKSQMERHGLTALKFTSDSVISSRSNGSVPGAIMTANLNGLAEEALTLLKQLQPDKPLWVMEYWTGTWDHWFEDHHTRSTATHLKVMETILRFPANINLYVFHGGTSFGFMNSATHQHVFPTYLSDVSSYDYDAPLSEAGDYTEKYNSTMELVSRYAPIKFQNPDLPAQSIKEAYPTTPISGQLTFEQIIDQVPSADRVTSTDLEVMERLDINNRSGQSYGFILYRKSGLTISSGTVLRISGKIRDYAIVLVDGVRKTPVFRSQEQQKTFGYFDAPSDAQLTLDEASVGESRTLDILVENWGHRDDTKGITTGSVLLDDVTLQDWEIVALQLKGAWVNGVTGWNDVTAEGSATYRATAEGSATYRATAEGPAMYRATVEGPAMYRATVEVSTPHDTFLDMSSWGKGNVFVNGFNIGRYFNAGPSKTMYIPAPLLTSGSNEIVVVELFAAASELRFSNIPILG